MLGVELTTKVSPRFPGRPSSCHLQGRACSPCHLIDSPACTWHPQPVHTMWQESLQIVTCVLGHPQVQNTSRNTPPRQI